MKLRKFKDGTKWILFDYETALALWKVGRERIYRINTIHETEGLIENELDFDGLNDSYFGIEL